MQQAQHNATQLTALVGWPCCQLLVALLSVGSRRGSFC
jgi:hypothetical protein